LIECIGFEFKIHLNSNSLCIVWKRKREKKKRIEKGNPTRRPNPLPPSLFSPRPSPPPQPAQTPRPARVAPAQLPPFLSRAQPRLPLPVRPSATAHFPSTRPNPLARVSPVPRSRAAHSPRALIRSPIAQPHLLALLSPPCRTFVCWPGHVSRRALALGHPRHVYSPAITAASSARGLRLLEPGTLETDRTRSVVRIRNHRGRVACTPRRLPAPS